MTPNQTLGGGAASWVAVCSAKPRASTQSAKGHQWWRRDVYHIRHPLDAELTLCERDCSDWLVIGPIDGIDPNCCKRCAARTLPQ